MIYLIDDKELRQKNDFGWETRALAEYSNYIKPIYNLIDLEGEKRDIFHKDNIVLFHESFFDNPKNISKANSDVLRQKLIDYSEKTTLKLVIFSGSIGSRKIENNLGYTYPANIYENLKYVLHKASSGISQITIQDFLFGKNYRQEQALHLKKQIWELFYRSDGKIKINNNILKLIKQFNDLSGKNISLSEEVDVLLLKTKINK